jgi:hypothetical protein
MAARSKGWVCALLGIADSNTVSGNESLSVICVVCFQVEVSASG